MNTKNVPAIIMLLAGAITSITTYLLHYELQKMMLILLGVLILFYIIGLIVKKIFDSFQLVEEKVVNEEGAMVEKEVAQEEEDEEE